MADFKPNHICKNPKCTKGDDGGRKKYYACNFCDHSENWRSVACSFECYMQYTEAVIEARTKGHNPSTIPERTDMSNKEVEELLNKPVETVLEETKEELKDFADIDGNVDFAKAVDEINEDIEKKKKTATRTRRKKVVGNE